MAMNYLFSRMASKVQSATMDNIVKPLGVHISTTTDNTNMIDSVLQFGSSVALPSLNILDIVARKVIPFIFTTSIHRTIAL